MKSLYEKTIKNYLKMLLGVIIVTLCSSLAFWITSWTGGRLTSNELIGYILDHCAIPACIDFIIYFVARMIIASPHVSSKKKNFVTFISLDLVVLVTALVNYTYTILWGGFAFAVMVAAIFGYKLYLYISVGTGILCTTICLLCELFVFEDERHYGTSFYIMQFIIALLFICVAALVSNLIRGFVVINRNFIVSQQENQDELTERLSKDAMTGLFNHSAFYDLLNKQIEASKKSNEALALAVLDIDDFKLVNDHYGHARGDEVILTLSRILQSTCRSYIVSRYGGEEFTVIFNGCDYQKVVECMEQALEEFKNTNFVWCNRPITFSCGVCSYYDEQLSAEDLFKKADKYLYKAKNTGKNKVVYRKEQ